MADLDEIRRVSGCARILIGETGFARSIWGAEAATARTAQVHEAAASWGVSYLIHWNLYDQDAFYDYGLFDRDGVITPVGQFYQRILTR